MKKSINQNVVLYCRNMIKDNFIKYGKKNTYDKNTYDWIKRNVETNIKYIIDNYDINDIIKYNILPVFMTFAERTNNNTIKNIITKNLLK